MPPVGAEFKPLRIFISYRRDDTDVVASLLRSTLENHGDVVILDVDAIPIGEDFKTYIREEIPKCHVVLVLIGPNWDTARLSKDQDVLALEIREALASPRPRIIPVLYKADMPLKEDLPEDLRPLTEIHAAQLRPDPDLQTDLAKLLGPRGLGKIRERVIIEEGAQEPSTSKPDPPSTWERFVELLRRYRRLLALLVVVLLAGAVTIARSTLPRPPLEIVDPGQQTSTEGGVAQLQIETKHAGTLGLHYEAEGLPVGLSVDAATGRISGRVAPGVAGKYPVALVVQEGDERADAKFTWIVRPPLAIVDLGPRRTTAGNSAHLQVETNHGDTEGLRYRADGLPPGLSINPKTGLISGTVAPEAAGKHTVSVLVEEGNQKAEAQFTWTVRPKPGYLQLVFIPWGHAWVNGQPYSEDHNHRMRLSPGRKTITAGQSTLRDEATYSTVVVVEPGEHEIVEIRF